MVLLELLPVVTSSIGVLLGLPFGTFRSLLIPVTLQLGTFRSIRGIGIGTNKIKNSQTFFFQPERFVRDLFCPIVPSHQPELYRGHDHTRIPNTIVPHTRVALGLGALDSCAKMST